MHDLMSYLQPIRRRISVRFVIDRDPDHRKSIFLAGSCRSGGAWICEALNQHNDYRYIFEPFHPKRAPWMKPFPPRKYMRPDEEDPEFFELARAIVTGRMRDPWCERFNWRLIAHERLIKEDFANLMLKWLHVKFQGMPLILVLRHPCAIALSHASHGFRHSKVAPLLEQEKLVEDFLRPYMDELRRAHDPFERAVFLWCIETLVPLKQFRPGEVHILFYENLVREPASEIEKLCSYLGKSPEGINIKRLDRPSLTARRATSAVWTGEDRVEGWQKKVTDAQRRRAAEIVAMFGLDRIYTDEPLPRVEGIQEIMNGGRSGALRTQTAPQPPDPSSAIGAR